MLKPARDVSRQRLVQVELACYHVMNVIGQDRAGWLRTRHKIRHPSMGHNGRAAEDKSHLGNDLFYTIQELAEASCLLLKRDDDVQGGCCTRSFDKRQEGGLRE